MLSWDPLGNASAQQLFGFRQISHHTFRILHKSPMEELAREKKLHFDLRTECQDLIVTKPVLRRSKLVETCFSQAFCERILAVNKKIFGSLAIRDHKPATDEPLGMRLHLVFLAVFILSFLRGRDFPQPQMAMELKR